MSPVQLTVPSLLEHRRRLRRRQRRLRRIRALLRHRRAPLRCTKLLLELVGCERGREGRGSDSRPPAARAADVASALGYHALRRLLLLRERR